MTPRDWNEMKKLLADVAKGNDVQEVLTQMAQGVTAEFKSPVKVTTVDGVAGATAVNATGKGYIDFTLLGSATGYKFTLVIDGVTLCNSADMRELPMIETVEYCSRLKMRFNKSVKLTVAASLYAYGMVVFEE